MGSKPTPRGGRVALATVLAGILVGASACASDDGDALWLAPIGHHEVAVGDALLWPLRHQGGQPPLVAELVAGPASAIVLQADGGHVLGWAPTAFDLAPTKPGAARAAGPRVAVVVRLRDRRGEVADALGTVRAVPAADKR